MSAQHQIVMQAKGLVKRYGQVTALDGADFELGRDMHVGTGLETGRNQGRCTLEITTVEAGASASETSGSFASSPIRARFETRPSLFAHTS